MLDIFNLHFTDACNYYCKHCFVKKDKRELSVEDITKIIDNVEQYFLKNKIENGRINLAGGEPLTVNTIQEIIDRIYSKKIKVSLVTNGSLLTEKFVKENREKISTIGISVDALNNATNKLIGRCDKYDHTLSYKELVSICQYIKSMNIKLKINICVSRENINENFHDFLTEIHPDRLKLLQMTICEGVNDSSISNTITEDEFRNFCKDYNEFYPVIEPSEKIKDSYLIIDSKGCIGTNNFHRSIHNLLKEELNDIIDEIKIDMNSYNERYT
jgi:radical S-adenosyl methionine domain-containing protein 2